MKYLIYTQGNNFTNKTPKNSTFWGTTLLIKPLKIAPFGEQLY